MQYFRMGLQRDKANRKAEVYTVTVCVCVQFCGIHSIQYRTSYYILKLNVLH